MRRNARQMQLPLPSGRGGKRRNAGRKPAGFRAGTPHRQRPCHDFRHPLHLTLRVDRALGNLRRGQLPLVIEGAVGTASTERFRIVHYSVQPDHLHLVAEARDRAALMAGAKGFAVRAARAINRALGRKGQVFCDRYHARNLATPLEVRRVLTYVLLNAVKHTGEAGVDPRCSSGRYLVGWKQPVVRPIGPAAVAPPATWLAATGWRTRHGPISVYEAPAGTWF